MISPYTKKNPFSKFWGRTYDNRPNPTQDNFVEYMIHQHWYTLVLTLRQYAREVHNKEILITSNGIYPFVDFHSVGFYPYNHDKNTKEQNYMPLKGKRFDGTVSMAQPFNNLLLRANAISRPAPVVVFIDWPTSYMDAYYSFTHQKRIHFLKLYTSQAYAQGLYFAMPVKTSLHNDPTARDLSITATMKELTNFYKTHQSIFTQATPVDLKATTLSQNIAVSTTQLSDNRYAIHLVNHNDKQGNIMTQENIRVDFSLPKNHPSRTQTPHSNQKAFAVSHEFNQSIPLILKEHGPAESTNNKANSFSVVIPELKSYIAIIIAP